MSGLAGEQSLVERLPHGVEHPGLLRCQRNIEVRKLELTDSWAVRELKICVRSFENFTSCRATLGRASKGFLKAYSSLADFSQ
jgi:hypothetical protein